jgi:hypothetical protein
MTIVKDPPTTRLAEYLIEGVYAAIFAITLAVWTVVGFVVWVPLLVRTTSIMAATVFYAVLVGDQGRVAVVERGVHFAVHFYVRGFRHFFDFYEQRHHPETPTGLLEPLSELKWNRVAVECVWVFVVWAAIYLIIEPVVAMLLRAV